MKDCRDLEALLTPYVDGEVTAEQCAAIEAHLADCPPCRQRADVEAGARTVVRRCRDRLRESAPPTLHAACRKLAAQSQELQIQAGQTVHAAASGTAVSGAAVSPVAVSGAAVSGAAVARPAMSQAAVSHVGADTGGLAPAPPRQDGRRGWRWVAPLSVAATVVLAAAGILLYGLGERSKALAQELATDHLRCMRFVGDGPAADRTEMAARWKNTRGWAVALPPSSTADDMQFVALRRCRHAGGELAHALYRHRGRLVSLFIFPDAQQRPANLEIMGQHAAIWSQNGRSYAVIAETSPDEVERLQRFFARAVE